jgi:hypothetical protein
MSEVLLPPQQTSQQKKAKDFLNQKKNETVEVKAKEPEKTRREGFLWLSQRGPGCL